LIGIFYKEVNAFFSSLTGYISIIIFLLMTGLFMWFMSQSSVLSYNYATMNQLFSIGPIVFMFLIPAVTMQTFAEEKQNRTLEFLTTKPLTDWQIISGKYLACLMLILMAIAPTIIYYISIVQLGSPKGNIDNGAVIGSYIGLYFLAAIFASIGMLMSSLTSNQIVAFILAAFGCFLMFWFFDFIGNLPVFFGNSDDLIKSLGIDYHYNNISQGRIDSRDVIYFLSMIGLFLWLTFVSLDRRKW